MMDMGRQALHGAVLAIFLLAATGAVAATGGAAIKADNIRSEPFGDARAVGALAPGDKVEIIKKDGGWFQIKSAKGTGWVRMLSIRRGDAQKASAGKEVAGLLGLASGRAGTGQVVATTGVRGLNEEELKSARFNEKELNLAKSFLTSKQEAQAFAVKGRLVSQQVEYLPEPAASQTSDKGESSW